MAFTRRWDLYHASHSGSKARRLAQYDPPRHYSNPLAMDDPSYDPITDEMKARWPALLPAPTGMDEVEDAKRLVALQLNPNARVCINCEVYFEVGPDRSNSCHMCWCALQPVGTKFIKPRFKVV